MFGSRNKQPKIFISYRRSGEGAGYGGRLADKLEEYFGPRQCFRDVKDIASGVDFVEAINDALDACEVLIVVIGPDWLKQVDERGRPRLENPNDFVRLEVSTALKRNIRVIPVLVGGALVPEAQELPDDLRTLSRRQVLELTDTRWDYDIKNLIASIESIGLKGRAPLEHAAFWHRIKIGSAVILTGAVVITGMLLLPRIFPSDADNSDPDNLSQLNSLADVTTLEDELEREREAREEAEAERQRAEDKLERERKAREEEERAERPISGLRGEVTINWLVYGYYHTSIITMNGSRGTARVAFASPRGPGVVEFDLTFETAASDDRSHDYHLVGSRPNHAGYTPETFGVIDEGDDDFSIVDACDPNTGCPTVTTTEGYFRAQR